MRINLVNFLCLFLLISCSKEYEEKYFSNGQVKLKVELKDGIRDGNMIEYFPDGSIRCLSKWKEGKPVDTATFYLPNNILESKAFYKNGKLKKYTYFFPGGILKEVQLFYNNQNLVDYYKYKKNGQLDMSYRHPIFIPESDTISLGDVYYSKIRLGNRMFRKIRVNIVDIPKYNDGVGLKYFGDTLTRLINEDSLTAILEVRPNRRGSIKITGVIYDIYERGDTLKFVPIPFKHYFFVK